jgi:transposase
MPQDGEKLETVALNGVGKTMAAIFIAEIGDVSRFASAEKLCCWAGLTPRHRESDTKVRRGHISKMGSSLVRWAAVEAVARYHGGAPIAASYERIAARRGNKIARVAAARKLLTLVTSLTPAANSSPPGRGSRPPAATIT